MATLQLKYHLLLEPHICKNSQSKTIVTCVDVTLSFCFRLTNNKDYNQDPISEIIPELEGLPL